MNLQLLYNALFALGLTASVLSLVYLVVAARCLHAFGRLRQRTPRSTPPVTILKPVCGLDHDLYENLRSFCEQDYPEYQVVFAICGSDDPALEIIERLIEDLRQHDLALAVGDHILGSNHKVSNLVQAHALAKHDVLVIADSDMRVEPYYLRALMAEFDDPGVGAVTCLYKGIPVNGGASVLAAAFINEWFLPSVLVALSFQPLRFCFGATMAVRRDVLEEIGGLRALACYLADDYMLGKLVSDCGRQVRLAPYLVENVVLEPDFKSLFLHELRWARTVRTLRRPGYALSFVTYAVPTSLLFTVLFDAYSIGLLLVGMALMLRLQLRRVSRTIVGGSPTPAWLVPIRDLLGFAVWAASFLGRDVEWRQRRFFVQGDGRMQIKEPDLGS